MRPPNPYMFALAHTALRSNNFVIVYSPCQLGDGPAREERNDGVEVSKMRQWRTLPTGTPSPRIPFPSTN